MEPRISLTTLGVSDLESVLGSTRRALAYLDGFVWEVAQ